MDESAYRKRLMLAQLDNRQKAYFEKIRNAPPEHQRQMMEQLRYFIYKQREEIMRMG